MVYGMVLKTLFAAMMLWKSLNDAKKKYYKTNYCNKHTLMVRSNSYAQFFVMIFFLFRSFLLNNIKLIVNKWAFRHQVISSSSSSSKSDLFLWLFKRFSMVLSVFHKMCQLFKSTKISLFFAFFGRENCSLVLYLNHIKDKNDKNKTMDWNCL